MFQVLQACNSQEVAVTRQERTSHDRKLPGSDVISPEITCMWLWEAENSGFVYVSAPTGL